MNVETSKFKNIKKVTGIILILVMLLLPFTSLLNVKAETTQITVDSNVTKSDDPNSKKVVNTTKLTVTGGTDLLKAYKVLDIYYNEKNNEMSYDFTSDFTNFKSSSYATTTTKDFSTLTVNEYLAYGANAYGEAANQSEFDLLAAQFAKYIRKNNIAGLEFTSDTTTVPEGENSFKVYIESIEAGAYLILPTTNNPFTDSDGLYSVNTYGALIANVVFTVQDGSWYLDAISRSIKQRSNYLNSGTIDCAPSKIIETLNSEDGPTFTTSFYKNREYSYFFGTSVLNRYTTEDSPWKVVITLPDGIDYTDIYTLFSLKSGMYLYPAVNNKLYNGDEVIANITTSEKTITIDSPTDAIEDFELMLIVGVKLSDNPVLGEAGNTIKTAVTYTTDPYSDPIGTTTLTAEDKITTYGLQITNKSAADDTTLDGGVFGIYTDSTCSDSSKIGEVTVTNGVGKFEGIIEGDLYVKQIKAPSGYRLSTDIAHATVDTASLTTEGYYPLEVTNAKAGLLPSTGGLGTIFYTLIGLLVVGAGAYEVVKYSKKQINS